MTCANSNPSSFFSARLTASANLAGWAVASAMWTTEEEEEAIIERRAAAIPTAVCGSRMYDEELLRRVPLVRWVKERREGDSCWWYRDRIVSSVSVSETRWESNVSRARERSSAETVNALLCLREARRRETWDPACCLADAREEEAKARSNERYQRRRSKLLLTRMSIAGLRVSITLEGWAALNEEGVDSASEVDGLGAGCFS